MKIFLKILIVFVIHLLMANCSLNSKLQEDNIGKNSQKDQIKITNKEFGAITGKIVTEDPLNRIGLILYLGQIITDSNGLTGGFLDTETAPVAIYDSDSGEFTFNEINPGEYSLIIHEVVLGGQVLTDGTGNIQIIIVKSGEVTDLGEFLFSGF